MSYQTAGFKRMMNTYNITPGQLRAIHALLNEAGLMDEKADIVGGFTGGRTTHVREMKKGEAMALIQHLKSASPQPSPKEREYVGSEKMRNKILSMAHEMGWHQEGTNKIDMKHVNDWCLKYGYLHKKLDDYTYSELPRLVTQVEGVYKDFIRK